MVSTQPPPPPPQQKAAGDIDPKLLTKRLTTSENMPVLISHFRAHQHAFNAVHCSAFWSTMGKLVRRSRDNAAWVAAHERQPGGELARARELTAAMLLGSEVGSREVANMAHGVASAGLPSSGPWAALWEALEQSCAPRWHAFNPQGLCNAVWAFATAGHEAPALYATGRARIIELLAADAFNSQGICNSAWALATAGHWSEELVVALDAAVARHGAREYKDMELSNLAWAYAKSGAPSPATFTLVADAVSHRLSAFTPQGLVNLIWAFATLGEEAPAFFGAVEAEIIGEPARLRSFNEQELSLTAWSYATMNVSAPRLFTRLAAEATRRVNELSPQAVSNLAWAFVSSNHSAPALLDALALRLERHAADFAPKGIAIATWALATVAADEGGGRRIKRYQGIFGRVAEQTIGRVDEFNQQGLSNIAWAFATVGVPARPLFNAIAAAAAAKADTFTPQGLHILTWSYAKQGYAADALFRALIPHCVRLLDEMALQGMSGMLWAYATLGYAPAALFQPYAAKLHGSIDELSAQGLANLGWACAVADATGGEIESLFAEPTYAARCGVLIGDQREHGSSGTMYNEHLRQVHQWEMWRAVRSKGAVAEGRRAWAPLPQPLAARAQVAFASNAVHPSQLQRQVLAAISSLGLSAVEEVMTAEGYSLDIVVRLPRRRAPPPPPEPPEAAAATTVAAVAAVAAAAEEATAAAAADDTPIPTTVPAGAVPPGLVAIEVDGPTHFLHKSKRPTGATHLKRRQLRAAGWRLRSVPYFDWPSLARHPALKTDEALHEARREYVTRLLGLDVPPPGCGWPRRAPQQTPPTGTTGEAVVEEESP